MRLTPEEIRAAAKAFAEANPPSVLWDIDELTAWSDALQRAIADAQLGKVLRVLASQCGDDPCKGCEILALWPGCPSSQGKNPRVTICPSYAKHLGQLAQAAKQQQLLQEAVKQEQQRIVKWIDDYADHSLFGDPLTAVVEMLDSLRAWLQERGKHE